MDKKERLENIFRKNLYDLEASPDPDSWKKIARTLDRMESGKKRKIYSPFWKKTTGTNRQNKLYPAAAFILLLLSLGGLWLNQTPRMNTITEQEKKGIATLSKSWDPKKEEIPAYTAQRENIRKTGHTSGPGVSPKNSPADLPPSRILVNPDDPKQETAVRKDSGLSLRPYRPVSLTSSAPSLVLASVNRKPATRKSFFRNWKPGIGGSSIGLASISPSWTSSGNDLYYDPTDTDPDDDPPRTRALMSNIPEESEVKHGYPLSFGFSLSHPLKKRLSLNTGLTYTYLPSRWRYKYRSGTAGLQRLHLVGIPVSVTYRLNDWKRPYCYATAGILAEVNVAGRLRTPQATRHIRIPGLLWSANARIGLSYPLIRFLSVYGEAGLCYYFGYNSDIETIRSEDPFKVSAQIGLRLNL